MAGSESLTTLNLVFNNIYSIENIDALWDAVRENATLTTLNLTFNNNSEMRGDLTLDMDDGLAKNTSLTTMSLTVSNYGEIIQGLTLDMGDGFAGKHVIN